MPHDSKLGRGSYIGLGGAGGDGCPTTQKWAVAQEAGVHSHRMLHSSVPDILIGTSCKACVCMQTQVHAIKLPNMTQANMHVCCESWREANFCFMSLPDAKDRNMHTCRQTCNHAKNLQANNMQANNMQAKHAYTCKGLHLHQVQLELQLLPLLGP